MTKQIKHLTACKEWLALSHHQMEMADQHMRDWFLRDSDRFSRYSMRVGEIMLDYSRNRINDTTLTLLCQLANAVNLPAKMAGLYAGHPLNMTEKRAALHTALRDKHQQAMMLDGVNISELIASTLHKMRSLTDKIQRGEFIGVSGKPIKHIVTLGVGGSYLGTKMCCHALKDVAVKQLHFHFISSVDKALLNDVIDQIDPETTLLIISSKTFSTLETMTNAHTLVTWMQGHLGHDMMKHHVIAITANIDKALAFGLPMDNIFPLWEWVGGRYSIWSAIGLPLMLMIGTQAFDEFLDGAYEMDQHFKQTEFSKNMPVLLALLSIWYTNFFHASAQAIVPYAHRLRYLIPYLQQADMESNGKRTNSSGEHIGYSTGPIIFGEEGCNGQHSYHQLLHQGQHLIPVDFILIGKPTSDAHDHHQDILVASGLSQAQALMLGKTFSEAREALVTARYPTHEIDFLAEHQVNPGNRPSNVLFLERLTPKNLGSLLALYEHKIFVQGAIWDINSFDQWGVELGKQLLPNILNCVQGRDHATHADSATAGLIDHFRKIQGGA